MTNKPMLSVERDTLEWVLNCWPKEQKGNSQEVIPSQVKELRALLDRPETPYVPKAGWSFKYVENGVIVIRNGEDWTIIKPGDGPIYEQFLYRFCEEQLNKTAAQHQGGVTLEQVLKAYDYANSHPHKYLRGTTNWCAAVAHALNVQQPAPVAVVIDIESAAKKIAERMDYPWECMPEQGRNSMRENAKAIVDAAMLNGVKP